MPMTARPAASAFAALAEPGRRPTAISFVPLSFRLFAWAKPWLP